MFSPRVKAGVFVLEGLNSFATMIYFTYLFFVMRDRFGFTNLENLTLCAANGAVYAGWVSFAGKLAQRRGYFWALKLGFGIMGGALLVGSVVHTVAAQYAVMMAWTFGIGFTWPCLEAITSEHEPPLRLQRMLGIYNLVWSLCGGVAVFVGGGLLGWLGPRAVYLVPAGLHTLQLVLAVYLHRESRRPFAVASVSEAARPARAPAERARSAVSPRAFLIMGWLANPFAYVAMNAVIPVIPDLARRFSLSAAEAGVFGSVWALSRAVGFLLCWRWTGWHYRFRWLFWAYTGMVVSFALILLGRALWPIVAAQMAFGLCLALIYYSSLFYSMDVGDTKGEHGGFHEAAIGAGIFGGPAVGAASLYFFPTLPNMNAWAVSALLLAGLAGLGVLRRRGARPPAEPTSGRSQRH